MLPFMQFCRELTSALSGLKQHNSKELRYFYAMTAGAESYDAGITICVEHFKALSIGTQL